MSVSGRKLAKGASSAANSLTRLLLSSLQQNSSVWLVRNDTTRCSLVVSSLCILLFCFSKPMLIVTWNRFVVLAFSISNPDTIYQTHFRCFRCPLNHCPMNLAMEKVIANVLPNSFRHIALEAASLLYVFQIEFNLHARNRSHPFSNKPWESRSLW